MSRNNNYGDCDDFKCGSRSDFTDMFMDFYAGIDFKVLFILFVIFLFVSSDVFINKVLNRFNGAVDYKNTTSYGTVLQGLFLTIIFALSMQLKKSELI